MLSNYKEIFLKGSYKKLLKLENPKVNKVIFEAIELMNPKSVILLDDSIEDEIYIKEKSIELQEEKNLSIEGHTIHYDSFGDQARDKVNTRVLIEPGEELPGINTMDREEGLKEILSIMKGIMKERIMIVSFYCLGPVNSIFSIPALQITDSFYVAHSENILYRPGYEQFLKIENKEDFFYFYHSSGPLDPESKVSIDLENRRIYVDTKLERVLTVNNQYAGNSLASKKLALRLAIHRSNNSNWLTEHMFLAGFSPLDESRWTYFIGAYPSACGKTSTAMIPGSKIVGDDIVYIRNIDGEMKAVNIEQGCFGIIKDVNELDDPEIFRALTTPRELILSNVLHTIEEKEPFWIGCGKENIPTKGYNHSGDWFEGKEIDGVKVPISHPNSRFTLKINALRNADLENLHNPNGVTVGGILYGGRDSDTNVPVYQAHNWEHGVFIGATIESESTAATLGKAGVRNLSPMAISDFLIVKKSLYFNNHLNFVKQLNSIPPVFGTNYFLKNENGEYLNTKLDKKVWVIWAEGRIHGDYDAIDTPIGLIPKYEDLAKLFNDVFNGRIYSKEEYIEQFSIRVGKYLEKLKRMEPFFNEEEDIPEELWIILRTIKEKLLKLKIKHGDLVNPFLLNV